MAKQLPIELFMPPNILKAKVGGVAVGLDMAAVKRADVAMQNLKSEFTDWMSKDVERLAAAHQRFLKERNMVAREDLFRASHDIKGQAATFNFPLIAQAASSLCKLIDETKTVDALPPHLIEAHVAAIRVIFREKINGASDTTAQLLMNELDARVKETLGAKKAG
jgi:chemotaxis protein histidine kinase CheA